MAGSTINSAGEKVADSPFFHFLLPDIRNILRGSGKPSTHHPLPPSIPPCPALQHHCHTASSLFIYSFRTGAADPLRNNALGIFFFFLTSPTSTEENTQRSIFLIRQENAASIIETYPLSSTEPVKCVCMKITQPVLPYKKHLMTKTKTVRRSM